MQHMAASDGISVYHRDDGLGQRADLFLHVQYVETGHSVCSHISSAAFHMHVATRTEGFVACSGQHHNADVAAFTAVVECVLDIP